ncbi:MAG TPA: hypothetical protein VN868_00040 [Terriglobales bacterium]|jgi:hypothetical protein|nr:hypothetical protein [Terriglobales bacterium]
MSDPFLKRLIEMCCRHRFSWPHNGVHGQAYQVCLLCGATYAYDCSTMRRTGRMVVAVDPRYQVSEQEATGE